MSTYCRTEWVKILPSLSCDIPRLCRVSVDAEGDNSNQLNEEQFGKIKHGKIRQMYEADAGLHIQRYWEQDKVLNKLWVNDLERINIIIADTNRRRQRKKQKLTELAQPTSIRTLPRAEGIFRGGKALTFIIDGPMS